MKNFRKISIILIILLSFTFPSCFQDLLETVPNDRISSNIFWQTDQDAVYAVNALYNWLENDWTYIMWDGMTDISHVTLTWRDESYIEKGVYASDLWTIEDKWAFYYGAIQTANIFMDNVGRVETNDQELIDRLTGEVRVIRAFQYMRLASLWGDVPLLISQTSLAEAKELTRTPVAQIWDFVESELTAAAQALPVTQQDVGRITKGAALGLKARAMLYAGRYASAATAAKAVMDLGVYDLYPSYEGLFGYAAENCEEIIFDRQYLRNLASNRIFYNITPNSLWQQVNQVVPTKNIVDAYEMTNGKSINDANSGFDPYNPYQNRDPRLRYSVIVLGDTLPDGSIYNSKPNSGTGDAIGASENSTPTGFNQKKYLNPEDLYEPWNCGINLVYLRYAEVLLTYAEAKIEQNQIDASVLAAINKVRTRPDVNMPEVTTTLQSELRKIVRHERMVELPFEGLRMFDILRWKTAEDVMQGTVKGMTYVNEAGNLTTVEMTGFIRKFNPARNYLFPIPYNEIQLNQNLTQNPGW